MSDKDKKALVVIPTSDLTATGPSLIKMAEYEGDEGIYEIFGIDDGTGNPSPLVETEAWRLFVAKNFFGQLGLMKVNSPENPEAYAMLEREVRILRTLQTVAAQIDEETEGPNKPFHGAFLPQVLETIEPEDGKLIVFLGYHSSIMTYRQLQPLSMLTADVRVDMQTGTWIFGKTLKTLAFIHSLGFGLGFVDVSNVFVETEVHGVLFLDLTSAIEEATEAEQLAEVAAIARVVWNAVGGTDESQPPHDEEIMSVAHHQWFTSVLQRMMDNPNPASEEHRFIYMPKVGLADTIFPLVDNADKSGKKRQFHFWSTYPRS